MFDFPTIDFQVPLLEEEPERHFIDRPIYTLDCETDPFRYAKVVMPFVWGFYDGTEFRHWWGPDCTAKMLEYLASIPPGIIYMHNGGKFDIYFLIETVLGYRPAFIVNRRIVRAYMRPEYGRHELRDSYAIMPFAFAETGEKKSIDYDWFEPELREAYRDRIVEYLEPDVIALHQYVSNFLMMFGNKLTIGSVAMQRLRQHCPFEKLGPTLDADIRKHYYYGGRVECLQRGILSGPWKVYDVNSMYPGVMKNFLHPMESPGLETTKIRKDTCFITAEGTNYGAFPQRAKTGGLRFDVEEGIFHVSRHEWDAALDLNLFRPKRILRCINYRHRNNLSQFVDTYYRLRKQAKDSGDPFGTIFYKYVLNSAYGKFAQNPEKYEEWKLDYLNSPEPPRGKRTESEWKEGVICDDRKFQFKIWRRDSPDRDRYNIAVGASITGAARSVLMRAIAKADTPIYCDTDSIICRNLAGDGITIDSSILGAWKLEKENIDTAMIAGRKLYALMKDPKKHGQEGPEQCCKTATKGVKLGPHEIKDVCEGRTVLYQQQAPTFRLDGSVSFIERRIKLR